MGIMTVKISASDIARKKATISGIFSEVRDIVGKGGVVVYPTDTLYALGVSPRSVRAVRKIYSIKERPGGMHVSVALSSVDEIGDYAKMNYAAEILADKFLPGPLTIIMGNRGKLAAIKGDTISIRVPDNHVARALLKECGPLTATSANIHGDSDPRTIAMAQRSLGDRVDLYIDGGKCKHAAGSTVVDLTRGGMRVVREGIIPAGRLEDTIHAA